jgi:DNA replication and repair protein RecF
MVTSATYLRQKREEAILALAPYLQTAILNLTHNRDRLELKYLPSFTDNYLPFRAKEALLGLTLVGPHRDDLEIFINKKPAKVSASQGQLRVGMTALRIAQWQLFYEQTKEMPLFCIDDFGVHLDAERRNLLVQSLEGFGQVFLTSPGYFEIGHVATRAMEIGGSELSSSSKEAKEGSSNEGSSS